MVAPAVPEPPQPSASVRAKRKPITPSEPAKPAAKLAMIRLVLPESATKQAEVLGRGPEAAPAVVGILQDIGVM